MSRTAPRVAFVATVTLLSCASVVFAQPASLVKDIYPGIYGGSSTPKFTVAFGSNVIFAAADETTGTELWKSDGTAAGTVELKDIYPGPTGSNPSYLTVSGPYVYFTADDGSHGVELWRTDGTTSGTVLVKDLTVGARGSSPANLTDINGQLFFSANAPNASLLKTDGTTAGTVIVKFNWIVDEIRNFNGVAMISAGTYDPQGRELWKSDGTTAGTVLVKDINAGSGPSNPQYLRVLGSNVFFAANDGVSGNELWKSDGTAAGTVMVADINLGTLGSEPYLYGASGGRMYFRANDGTYGYEMWVTQGTAPTTTLLKDINPGSASSFPAAFADIGTFALFGANDGVHGSELWESDGTTAGTVLLKEVDPTGTIGGPRDPAIVVGSIAYFVAIDYGSTAKQIWRSDGTATGTVRVTNNTPSTAGDAISSLAAMGGWIFYTSWDLPTLYELWKTDGVNPGTLVKDINPGYASSNPANIVDLGNVAAFAATTSAGREPWKSDGTDPGTVQIKDVYASGSSLPDSLTVAGSSVFFSATTSAAGAELWKSDGTTTGTVLVKDIRPGSSSSSPAGLTNVNGTVLFSADDGTTGRELWKSDGTNAGTVIVKDIQAGSLPSNPTQLTMAGGSLYFAASESTVGNEPWRSDGTTAGTILLKDVTIGATSSNPTGFTPVGPTVFFLAADQLWQTDGTTANTVMVKDIDPLGTASPSDLTRSGSTLYFVATTAAAGRELWRSDGTAAGTVMVKDIASGSADSGPAELADVNGVLFFTATDDTNGRELWKTDGTLAGTVLVKDINPGSAGSSPQNLFNAVGKLLFVASDGVNGAELWVSDGTAAGTVQLQDLTAGAAGSLIGDFTAVGSRIFFQANNQTNGIELWSMPFSAICTPPATPAITGPPNSCAGTAVTLTATAGYNSYHWSTGATTQSIVVYPDVTTTYTVVGYNASGCPSNLASYTQTVTPNLTAVSIALSGAWSACATGTGGTATATDTGGGAPTHQWGYRTTSGGAITSIAGATGNSYMLTGSDFPLPGSYYLVVTTTPACGTAKVSNEISVSITALLSSATADLTGASSVCTGQTGGSITLWTSGGGTITRAWGYRTVSGGTITTIAGRTGFSYFITAADFPGTANYFVVGTATPSCGAPLTTNEIPVTIKQTPPVPTPASNSPVCAGQTLYLTVPAIANATYSWTGPNGFTSAQQNPSIADVTSAAAGNYTVAVTVDGCTSQASTSVVINATPSSPLAGNSGPVCEGTTASLLASTIPGATYTWSGPNGFSSTLQNPVISNVTTADAGIYSVTAIVNGCLSAPMSTVLTVIALPSQPSASSNSPVCAGGTVNLTTPPVANATYTWTGPNGFTSTEQNPSIPNATAAAAGTYDVTVMVAGCASQPGSTAVAINALPATPAISAPTGVLAASTGITASVTPHAGSTYDWTIANGSITAGQGTGQITFTAGTFGSVGLGVAETNSSGCTSDRAAASVVIVFPAPQNVTAAGSSATTVLVTWSPVGGAASYEVARQDVGVVGSTAGLTFNDTTATADTAYLYTVRARDGSNNASAFSNADLATTVMFTDDPLAAATTIVKMAHLSELRTAVDAVRALTPLGAFSFTDPALTADTVVKAVHVDELRTALDQARASLGLPPLTWTDPTLTPGTTFIKAAHLQEIREAVK